MVQKGSIIKNGDNSGISFLNCISIISKKKESKIFDFIRFSIKKFSKFKKRRIVKVKKSLVYKGLILSVNVFYLEQMDFFKVWCYKINRSSRSKIIRYYNLYKYF